MLSFSITWTRPDGRFGFTTIEDCVDMEDATTFFMDSVRGQDPAVPADAQIDTVRKVN
jgi:hypothetical protein